MTNKGYKYLLAAVLWVACIIPFPLSAVADPEGGEIVQGGYCGRGWYGELDRFSYNQEWSGAQIDRMQKARERFIDETRPLRRKIAETERALDAVLNSSPTDKTKAVALQKKLSDLWAQFDQKQLAYRLSIRSIVRENGGEPNTY